MALIRKRRLNKQQYRRIQQQQQHIETDDLDGLVVSHYGRELDIEVLSLPQSIDENAAYPVELNKIWRCHARTNLEMLVTGDRVKWRADTDSGKGVITTLLQRNSILQRPDRYHRLKPVASNIELVLIVFACEPEPAPTLIDRYLVACHAADLEPLLIINKADLITVDDPSIVLKAQYQALGYNSVLCSCNDKGSIVELQKMISHRTVLFVGQSGVGKSSLINQLLPDAQQRVNLLSERSTLGQHTTTSTRLLHLSQNTHLIDSPGIREFGLWHLNQESIDEGFVEFQPFWGLCKFRNCNHRQVKGCALQQAVIDGDILERRLHSYLRLCSELEK